MNLKKSAQIISSAEGAEETKALFPALCGQMKVKVSDGLNTKRKNQHFSDELPHVGGQQSKHGLGNESVPMSQSPYGQRRPSHSTNIHFTTKTNGFFIGPAL